MTDDSKPLVARFLTLSLLLVTLAVPRPATAEGPNLLALRIGAFDIVQLDEPAADFRLEYRHGTGRWILQPWAGLEATRDGAIFGVAGLSAISRSGAGLSLSFRPASASAPTTAAAASTPGSAFEIRSQLEVAWRLPDESRVGLAHREAGSGDSSGV